MVEVTFLGTGDAFSAGRRSNLALLITAPGLRMLVESGPLIMAELARVSRTPAELDAVFVSHGHGDHVLGFPMLALNRNATDAVLNVYAGHSTADVLEAVNLMTYGGLVLRREKLCFHRLSEEESQSIEVLPHVTMHTLPVAHLPGVPTLAARWDFAEGVSLTFVTDTSTNPGIAEFARGSDLLIHEANFSATLQPEANPAIHYHSTARQAGEIARRASCPRLALVHLGAVGGEHPDVLREEAGAGRGLDVVVPEDGQVLRLPASGRTARP